MNETRATRYQRLKRRGLVAVQLSGGLLLGVVGLTPLGGVLHRWCASLLVGLPEWLALPLTLPLFIAVLVGLWELATLPATVWRHVAVERRYGTDRTPLGRVLSSQLRSGILAWPVAILAALVVLVSVRLAGDLWPLPAGICLALGLVGAAHVAPALVHRVATVKALGRAELRDRLQHLARRAGVPVDGIDEWRGTTNALVVGVGRRRHVLLAPELVSTWTDEEIETVVAHELAHHAHHDLWRALVLDTVLLGVGLGVGQWVLARWVAWAQGEVMALPMLAFAMWAVWGASTPVRYAQSRAHERRADAFALDLTGNAEAFVAAIRRLGARHLSEDDPSRLTRWCFHRHPTVTERLAVAHGYGAGRGVGDLSASARR